LNVPSFIGSNVIEAQTLQGTVGRISPGGYAEKIMTQIWRIFVRTTGHAMVVGIRKLACNSDADSDTSAQYMAQHTYIRKP